MELPMSGKITRRDLLKGAAAASASLVPVGAAGALPKATPGSPSAIPPSGNVIPLTSTSDVFTPPRGRGFFKFSFDFPEPSVEFEGLKISFRLYTFENTYGLDLDRMTVETTSDGIGINCTQL